LAFSHSGLSSNETEPADRVLDVMKDFPPHRHVNGHVIYPEGYLPTPVEELKKGF